MYNMLYRQVFWIQGVWAIIACSLVMWAQVLFMQEVAKRDSGSSLILVIGAFFSGNSFYFVFGSVYYQS